MLKQSLGGGGGRGGVCGCGRGCGLVPAGWGGGRMMLARGGRKGGWILQTCRGWGGGLRGGVYKLTLGGRCFVERGGWRLTR